LPLPHLPLPAGFTARDPRRQLQLIKGDSLLRGSLTYEIDLVAAYPGIYRLGPARLYSYDPVRKRYDSLFSPVLDLSISGDSLRRFAGQANLDRFYQEALAQASRETDRPISWPTYLPLLCLALLLAAGGWRWWWAHR
ncbi:MAG: hypothetical protein D6722_11530, partial [Bacteroidetes bacterium]